MNSLFEIKRSNLVSFPKISVVMTVFNCQDYVGEAIESILRQTFEDFEFIIVDDKSTDKTREIILSYSDPRIVYVRNGENVGQTKSLNVGIRKSRGEFIARMDADDISYPKRLEFQYKFLRGRPDIAVVGSWCLKINEAGRSLKVFKVPADGSVIRAWSAASGELTHWCMAHSTVLIRKKALEEVGLYNEHEAAKRGYPQDYDLWTRMLKQYTFANIPKPLLKYRVLSNSDSRVSVQEALNARFQITRNRINFCLPGLNEIDLTSLANMLEFQPQVSGEQGGKVFVLFDRYFSEYMGSWSPAQLKEKERNRIKLYYCPVLFLTNKTLSVRHAFQIFFRYPEFLLDAKFYRKVSKALIEYYLPKTWSRAICGKMMR